MLISSVTCFGETQINNVNQNVAQYTSTSATNTVASNTVDQANAAAKHGVQTQPVTMCVDHYPPLQIFTPNGNVTGENVEIAKQFFSKLDINLTFTVDTPFSRCIQMLKLGKVDVMVGLLESKQRREDFEMLLYDDLTHKRFFVHKDGPTINKFSDLKQLTIATLRGVKQFKAFDEEDKLFSKVEVSSTNAAFIMLAKGRVDAVITTDFYGEQWLAQSPEFASGIVKADFHITKDTQTYIAISKKSPLITSIDRLKAVANSMFESGEFAQIILNFQTEHPEYYLDDK
ncbi:substrate-binding periplasmic protein [Colwellia sp. MEBiC06753]